jgi:PST family polysaccharide transporter
MMADLRRLAWRGGIAMGVRQLVGMAVSFAGTIALARLIGPKAFGTWVAALAVQTWLGLVCQWGVDVWLMRKPEDPTAAEVDQAITLTLATGAVVAALAVPAGWLAAVWTGIPEAGTAVTILLAGMPLVLAPQVPLALLQRRMAYGPVAWAELGGHAVLYAVAVGAAWAGAGLAAPLAGWWAQQLCVAVLAFSFGRVRPRLVWRPEVLRAMLGYGLGYSASVWVWQLRLLVNPLIVARVLGPEAAGAVSVAIRLAEGLSFMRLVIWRVALSAMGRLQASPTRLAAAVAEGMALEALAIGPPMAVFALLAPTLVPLAFGAAWAPVADLFPFLGVAYLVNGVFSQQSSALYALGRNIEVTVFHAAHVAMLVTAVTLLLPRFGLLGYGVAEVAALAAFRILHGAALRALGPIPVALVLAWTAGFAMALFVRPLGPAAWLGPLAVAAMPATWRTLAGWWRQVARLSLAETRTDTDKRG